ncbi:MAG: LiaF domain-containing protein [Ginsengibacter sp.]
MNTNKTTNLGEQNTRIVIGIMILIAGLLLLGYKMGLPIPGWIFSWPVIVIAIGLLIGIKSGFENSGSLIMILIGSVFLTDRLIPGENFRNYLVPIILITIGLIIVFRKRNDGSNNRNKKNVSEYFPSPSLAHPSDQAENKFDSIVSDQVMDEGETINIHAILGGVKRNIHSKNFLGGEILSLLGGSEINFMQADIQQTVILEVNSVLGGTKLIIPSNWDVQNNISAILGGIEDKRVFSNSIPDSNKKLILKGACVFGGIEVTNY